MQTFARVFALVPDCHGEPTRYSSLWRRHFYGGLAGAVSELVVPHDVDFRWARPAHLPPVSPLPDRAATSARLADQIQAARPDVVISCCFASDLEVGLVDRTVQAGVPWINFYCDSVHAFDRVDMLARVTSLNWFPEGAAVAEYRALGRPWLCRPYALNPAALPESVCHAARHPIGFVGAGFGNRVLELAALRLLGCKVTARGHGWRRQPALAAGAADSPKRSAHDRRTRGGIAERALVRLSRPLLSAGPPLTDDEIPTFVAACRIMLGLNTGRNRSGRYVSYLKSRDVEFPGYGSCYLVQHNDDVEKAFDVGTEVLTFRSIGEAAMLAREVGADPDRARAIGRAGRRRVLAQHTWATRLGELAAAL